MDYPDITCKIIFLGDAGVGKSSILRKISSTIIHKFI